jgi:hypothetical protein
MHTARISKLVSPEETEVSASDSFVGSPESPTADYSVKRRSVRHSFIDTAYFVEPRSEARAQARTSDLSLNGCYLETSNPLPAGTQVEVRLDLGGRAFKALGTVIHSQAHMGMGIEFTAMEPPDRGVLEDWVAQMSKESAVQA